MSGAYKYRPQYTQNTIGPDAGTPTRDCKGEIMQPHQERVVVEKKELDEKLDKLLTFIDAGAGPVFSKLNTEERQRLTTQARIMKEYSDVLADRIAAFK